MSEPPFVYKRLGLLLVSSAGAIVLMTLCGGSGCSAELNAHEGDPCTQGEVGKTLPYAGSGGCKSLVCDGTQYGPYVFTRGDSCSEARLICPPGGGGDGGCAPEYAIICNGTTFVDHYNVGPGLPCGQSGLLCHYPGTECQSCRCESGTFVCDIGGCCQPGCNEGGACPAPQVVIAGEPCQSAASCNSDYACGAQSVAIGNCTCSAGAWSCSPLAPCDDGGSDGGDTSDGADGSSAGDAPDGG